MMNFADIRIEQAHRKVHVPVEAAASGVGYHIERATVEVWKIMNFVFKMMSFAFKMMNSVLKTMNFVLPLRTLPLSLHCQRLITPTDLAHWSALMRILLDVQGL